MRGGGDSRRRRTRTEKIRHALNVECYTKNSAGVLWKYMDAGGTSRVYCTVGDMLACGYRDVRMVSVVIKTPGVSNR